MNLTKERISKLLINKVLNWVSGNPVEEKYGGTNDGYLAILFIGGTGPVDCSYAFTFAAHCSQNRLYHKRDRSAKGKMGSFAVRASFGAFAFGINSFGYGYTTIAYKK